MVCTYTIYGKYIYHIVVFKDFIHLLTSEDEVYKLKQKFKIHKFGLLYYRYCSYVVFEWLH